MKVKEYFRALVAMAVTVGAVATDVVADIPAPKTESAGADLTFVLMGAIFSFISALIFLWLGRKLFKKT